MSTWSKNRCRFKAAAKYMCSACSLDTSWKHPYCILHFLTWVEYLCSYCETILTWSTHVRNPLQSPKQSPRKSCSFTRNELWSNLQDSYIFKKIIAVKPFTRFLLIDLWFSHILQNDHSIWKSHHNQIHTTSNMWKVSIDQTLESSYFEVFCIG